MLCLGCLVCLLLLLILLAIDPTIAIGLFAGILLLGGLIVIAIIIMARIGSTV